jgi:hypothetical protein
VFGFLRETSRIRRKGSELRFFRVELGLDAMLWLRTCLGDASSLDFFLGSASRGIHIIRILGLVFFLLLLCEDDKWMLLLRAELIPGTSCLFADIVLALSVAEAALLFAVIRAEAHESVLWSWDVVVFGGLASTDNRGGVRFGGAWYEIQRGFLLHERSIWDLPSLFCDRSSQ